MHPEAHPPVIERAEVWPYPDLTRLWVRLETSPFTAFPSLDLAVYDPDGQLVSQMFMVEIRERYQSVTMHLRRPPRPGARYRLEITLMQPLLPVQLEADLASDEVPALSSETEEVLDSRALEFDLVFREPDTLSTGSVTG